jgi:DNA-binding CsgD family transcriptional regulator
MENRVLRLISLGCTVKQAAAILGRATRTIDKHKLHGMRKLGVHNQAMLTRRVIQLGVTSLEDALTSQERELAEAARSLKRRRA